MYTSCGVQEVDVVKEAIASVEESGIVFIDEIDKLVQNSDYRGADASSEGVQRVRHTSIYRLLTSVWYFLFGTVVLLVSSVNSFIELR